MNRPLSPELHIHGVLSKPENSTLEQFLYVDKNHSIIGELISISVVLLFLSYAFLCDANGGGVKLKKMYGVIHPHSTIGDWVNDEGSIPLAAVTAPRLSSWLVWLFGTKF